MHDSFGAIDDAGRGVVVRLLSTRKWKHYIFAIKRNRRLARLRWRRANENIAIDLERSGVVFHIDGFADGELN